MRPGASFEDANVARAYVHRPDYADAVYDRLLALSPRHGRLLDLGCGTGKISRRLAGRFQSVTAIDPSSEMLRVAKGQPSGGAANIAWVNGVAEEVPLVGGPFDVIVAAASIHWMNHDVVFPRLLSAVAERHVFAAVDGDGAFNPPWQAAWDGFLAEWIHELKGEDYQPGRPDSAYARRMNRYRQWLDVAGEATADSSPVRQRVEDFVACQHSRDTFAPARLGSRMRDFDRQLTGILEPHADNGVLTYVVRSTIVWGSIRTRP